MIYEIGLITWGMFGGVLIQYYYTTLIKQPEKRKFHFNIYLIDKPKKKLINKELQVDLDSLDGLEEVSLEEIPHEPLQKNWYNIFE